MHLHESLTSVANSQSYALKHRETVIQFSRENQLDFLSSAEDYEIEEYEVHKGVYTTRRKYLIIK